MPLPNSGQISLNDARNETSQSLVNNYELSNALIGGFTPAGVVYSPINVEGLNGSMGSALWSENNKIGVSNFSMSIWHTYDHTRIGDTTASLYTHGYSGYYCESKTMAIVSVGVANKLIDINVSGSNTLPINHSDFIAVYYGKPWTNNGNWTSSLCEYITGSYLNGGGTTINDIVFTYQYNYVYDSAKGENLYFVLTCNYCL